MSWETCPATGSVTKSMTFSSLLTVSMERTGRAPADDVLLLVLGFFDAEQLHNIALAKGFPADGTWTVTYNANGGSGSIDAVEVNAGDSITLNSGSTLTAPEGKEFVGWAKSSSAQSATVTSPFTPTKDETLYAVWADVTPAEEPTT